MVLPRAQLAQEEPERLKKIPAWIATDVAIRNGSDRCMAAKRFGNPQHLRSAVRFATHQCPYVALSLIADPWRELFTCDRCVFR